MKLFYIARMLATPTRIAMTNDFKFPGNFQLEYKIVLLNKTVVCISRKSRKRRFVSRMAIISTILFNV